MCTVCSGTCQEDGGRRGQRAEKGEALGGVGGVYAEERYDVDSTVEDRLSGWGRGRVTCVGTVAVAQETDDAG